MKMIIKEINEYNIDILSNVDLKNISEEALYKLEAYVPIYAIKMKRKAQLEEIIEQNGSMLKNNRLLTRKEIKEEIKQIEQSAKVWKIKIKELIKNQ